MIEFKDNFLEIVKEWKKKPEKFVKAMNQGFKEGLQQYETRVIKNQLSGRRSTDYGLKRQSGMAANSVNLIMSKSGNDLIGRIIIGKQAWYLKVHQHHHFAGFIRPKTKQWLTIPVKPGAVGRKASDFDLQFVKLPGKNPVLIGKGSDAGRGVVFALKKQVYIPKRFYFFEEFKTFGHRFIKDRIMRNLERIKNG